MQEIKCPNCGKIFQVDESGYAQILQQVRDKEFRSEIDRRERELAVRNEKDLAIARMEQEKRFIDEIHKKESEITELRNTLILQQKETELKENNIAEQYKSELRIRDEEIERLKDYKTRLSTKMVGESLEQHCMAQFNQIRMTAFPNAVFEKDNDCGTGSKGDFIFRESSEGTEFISIMFEMKNEMDTTKTKHKNEDFFKELDKDRNEKNCEYAVLVSLLESDNELYNNGIVDVSYRYPKMFVVRPQFFIPIISLLRNAALNSLEYKQKLAYVQSQELELNNFEENLSQFKKSFADSFRLASDRYEDAIKGIDNAIKALTKIKENLLTSEKHLNTANNKIEDVNIKRLTRNAPSVRELFEEIHKEE